jgi:hypothetical protein
MWWMVGVWCDCALQRDRDQLVIRERELQMKVDAGEAASRAVGVLEARARDSAARMTSLAAERDRAVVALKAELAKATGPAQKTVGELKTWSEQLQVSAM